MGKLNSNFSFSYSDEQKRLLLSAARASISQQLGLQDGVLLRQQLEKEPAFSDTLGAFVTLNRLVLDPDDIDKPPVKQLRGCIGNIIGIDPLFKGIWKLAKESAFADPRFPSLTQDELELLDIEISILSPLQEVDSYHQIRIGVDGILIEKGFHRALFLPQVATEQQWDLETTLKHLAIKAGIRGEGWKESDCCFEVFQAMHFSEEELNGSM